MAVRELEFTQRVPPKTKLTFEEYLDWCDEDTWAEWIDGEVIMVSPASLPHQIIGSFLEKVLGIYVESRGLGLIVRAPFVMRMDEISRGREPDLLFVQQDRTHLLKHTYLDGAADLVIEIISPESVGRDRGDKFVEYERVGVKEYWLLDPDRQIAEFYELANNGRYRLVQLGESETYHSKVIQGFWLRVPWLWQTPLPQVMSVLRELKIL